MAAKNGHVDVIRQFLKDKQVDQTIVRSTLLWEASRNGHLEVFRLLMDEGRLKPSIAHASPLLGQVSAHDFEELFRDLLKVETLSPIFVDDKLVQYRLFEHPDLLNLLMADPRLAIKTKNEIFDAAAKSGNLDVLKSLIVDPHIDSSLLLVRHDLLRLLLEDTNRDISASTKNSVLIANAKKGNLANVKQILNLNDSDIDLSVNNYLAISRAYESGHKDVVDVLQDHEIKKMLALLEKRELTQFGKVLATKDPQWVSLSMKDNKAIIEAAENGNTRLVEILLRYPDVNPAARHNMAIQMATKNGHVDVVRLLLKDKLVDQTIELSTLLWEASKTRNIEVFRLLLADPRTIVKTKSEIFDSAARIGNMDIMKALILDPRGVDSSILLSRLDLLTLLLEDTDKGVSASTKNSILTAYAKKGNLNKVNEILNLKDHDIDPSANNYLAISEAFEGGHEDVVTALEEHTLKKIKAMGGSGQEMVLKQCFCTGQLFPDMAGVTKTRCGHSFHTKCIKAWLAYQSSCPNCRAYLNRL